MEQKPPYVVNSDAPRTQKPIIPLQARNWPRWLCPGCQARHYLEIDILMAVTRLECSSCHRKWNVLTTFTDANASAKHKHSRLENAIARRSEDDIITDWDDNGTLAEDAQEVV
jgi:hypothetical protein